LMAFASLEQFPVPSTIRQSKNCFRNKPRSALNHALSASNETSKHNRARRGNQTSHLQPST
jgi:hypothetical protein